MKKLAIITTHPIQYNAPWFKLLVERGKIKPKVFYTWEQSQHSKKFDTGFDKSIEWDIPLLEGYEFTFVKNVATKPGSHHFNGIINPTLNQEIEEWKPDAILVFGWAFESHLSCIKYFHKRNLVLFRGDSTLLGNRSGILKIIRTIFLKWVYRHIDYALYTGTQNKLYFKKHGLLEDQLIFAPHAIDNDRFSDVSGEYLQAAQLWKKELGIDPKPVTILFAGKIEEKKNPFFLLKMMKEFPLIHFILVGSGKLETVIKNKARKLQNITFLPFQNQTKMPVVYRLADMFILPSKGSQETWGLAVNEAMACNKAVLVSNSCGCAIDLVKNEINGFTFKEDETGELFKKLRSLIKDKEVIKNMGDSSLEIIKSYSFINIVEPLESLLISYNF